MGFLRTTSTRRLLSVIAGLIALIAGGTAIAIAATDNAPLPPPASSLASALHQALSAPPVTELSARISFTNNLISSSDLESSDPILTGATGRLWLSGDRLRLELQSNTGNDAQIVVNGRSFWVYDPSMNTVYEGTLPAGASTGSSAGAAAAAGSGGHAAPSVDQIQSELTKLAAQLNFTDPPTPSDYGGAPAYTVRISPKHDGGLLGYVQLAWDASHGVPLDFSIYDSNNELVLGLEVTSIELGSVDSSALQISPPTSATVVKLATPSATKAKAKIRSARAHAKRTHVSTGAGAVQAALPFTLDAPASVGGLTRNTVALLDWGKAPAALVTYGQGLAGIAVIERSAHASSSSNPRTSGTGNANGNGDGGGGQGDGNQFTLPSFQLSTGDTAHELDTDLGSAIQFTHASVSYLVIGSVTSATAQQAAKDLVASR